MKQESIGTILAVSLLSLVLLAGAIGPAAAQTTTTTTETSPPLDQTVTVDGDTRSLFITAENATASLSATIYAVENGTETAVATQTLDATGNTTDSWEWELPGDPATEYRVTVDGASVEEVDLSTIERVPASGGGLLPSTGGLSLSTIPGGSAAVFGVVVLLVLAGAAYLQMRS